MMDKIYLFGAGINAYGIISYIGQENIIAVIDNNKKKQGMDILNIPIISFEKFLKKRSKREVVITAAIYDEIVMQLEKNNINNYSIAPMVTAGAILKPREIVDSCNIVDDVYLFGQNILMEKFCEYVLDNQKNIKLYKIKFGQSKQKLNDIEYINYKDVPYDANIIIFKENITAKDKSYLMRFKNIHDIYILKNFKRYEDLKKYKGMYNNSRCFIIGNGPSLRIDDLNRICKDKICSFGLNLIYKIFSDTIWRPTFLTISDYTIYRSYYDELANMNHESMFVRDFYEMEDTPHINGINYFPSSGRRAYYDKQLFSEDITKNVYSGYTVMYDALQIAIYMGFKDIYLVGADFSYFGEAIKQGNHIYDYKEKDRRNVSGTIHIDVSLNAFKMARRYAEENGIRIYNATRGGKLEVFERKNLDELFKEIEND